MLIVGFISVVFASERFGLRFGGVVVVPLLGMYMLFDYRALPLFAASTAVAYGSLLVIERRFVLFGRTTLLAAIAAGAVVPTTFALVSQIAFDQAFPLRNVAYLGSILPGLAAFNLHRLDREERLADIIGSLTLLGGLLLLAAFFLLIRSLLVEAITFEQVIRTAGRLFTATESPIVTSPSPILPRIYIVGLFVLGLFLNEFVQKRYGLRIAGVIAIPLMALFTLYDVRLLIQYVLATAICAGFIRLVHRSTFLYGRNLLAGTCMLGVVLGVLATPFLPADAGLRSLMIGILAGVSAYNGHVLAPTERVDSIVVTTGAFAGSYLLAHEVAWLLGDPVADSMGTSSLLVGFLLIALAGLALLQYETRRPSESIQQVSPEGGIVVDGGTETGKQVRPDGGATSPLAGRRIARIGPNAEVVYRSDE
jgi:hypothetical protein